MPANGHPSRCRCHSYQAAGNSQKVRLRRKSNKDFAEYTDLQKYFQNSREITHSSQALRLSVIFQRKCVNPYHHKLFQITQRLKLVKWLQLTWGTKETVFPLEESFFLLFHPCSSKADFNEFRRIQGLLSQPFFQRELK